MTASSPSAGSGLRYGGPALVALLSGLFLSGCLSSGVASSDPFARGGAGAASPSASQPETIRLTGWVTVLGDEDEAIADVVITLVDLDGSERAVAGSDSTGAFDLGSVEPGSYQARATLDGYLSAESAVEVRGLPPVRLLIELAADDAEEGLASTARVTARADFLETVGFYQRQGRESGSFLVEADIRRRTAMSASDVVVSLAGFRRRPVGNQLLLVGRRGCPPNLFIDGMEVGDTRQLDFLITVQSIAAIEAYPGSTPPAEFAGIGVECGAVAIWSKRG
jgi:hypothetical protein